MNGRRCLERGLWWLFCCFLVVPITECVTLLVICSNVVRVPGIICLGIRWPILDNMVSAFHPRNHIRIVVGWMDGWMDVWRWWSCWWRQYTSSKCNNKHNNNIMTMMVTYGQWTVRCRTFQSTGCYICNASGHDAMVCDSRVSRE